MNCLNWYMTGADSTGAVQRDSYLSLGGPYGSKVHSLHALRVAPIISLNVLYVSPSNGEGNGEIGTSDENGTRNRELRWRPPHSSDFGEYVNIEELNTPYTLYGPTGDEGKYITVIQTTDIPIVSGEVLSLVPLQNNAIGGDDISKQDEVEYYYRAVMLINDGTDTAEDIVVQIDSSSVNTQLAIEAPTAGALTVTADTTTAPSGVTGWDTTAFDIPDLDPGDMYGVWIRRISGGYAGYSGTPQVVNYSTINLSYTVDSVEHTDVGMGVFKVSDTDIAGYIVADFPLAGENQYPPDTSIDFTFTTFPETIAVDDLPVSIVPGYEEKHQIFVRKRNKYGLLGPWSKGHSVNVSDGTFSTVAPERPISVWIEQDNSGSLTANAIYKKNKNGTQATHWGVYVTSGAIEPDVDVDTPTIYSLASYGNTARLKQSIGTYLEDEPVHILVDTRVNVGTELSPSYISSYTEGSDAFFRSDVVTRYFGPDMPNANIITNNTLEYQEQPALETAEYVIDAGSDIKFTVNRTSATLYVDTTSIFTMRLSTEDTSANGIYTSFVYMPGDVTGASEDIFDVSEYVSDSLLYLCSDGTRRVKIDVANETITIPLLHTGETLDGTKSRDITWEKYLITCIQTWDRFANKYVTALTVDSEGEVQNNTLTPWRFTG